MAKKPHVTDVAPPDLSIPLETVCFLIMKAREFDVKDGVTEPNPGSNPADDGDLSVLEDHGDDPVYEELRSFIHDLNVDQQVDLVAISWLGRENYTKDDWEDVRSQAADAHNERTAEYLCGNPLLADNLADGLSALDYSCEDYETIHL